MPINIGYKENICEDGLVRIRVYYDINFTPVGPAQPLVDGPLGFCLECVNTSGRSVTVQVSNAAGTRVRDVRVGQGNPVGNRSLTAQEMAGLGMSTRGDVTNFTVTCK